LIGKALLSGQLTAFKKIANNDHFTLGKQQKNE
jgi:hypothetical protein